MNHIKLESLIIILLKTGIGLDCSIKLNDTNQNFSRGSVKDLHNVSSEDRNNFVSLKPEQRALGSSINRTVDWQNCSGLFFKYLLADCSKTLKDKRG